MNAREAKRLANFHAALALESSLSSGWETLEMYTAEERAKVEAGLEEIVAEFRRRSGLAGG